MNFKGGMMKIYKLVLVIKSEAILGSGISNVYIHEDCLYDERGFVYYHSKTLKGMLHNIAEKLGIREENRNLFFGNEKREGSLIFSNLEIPAEIKKIVKDEKLLESDILNLQTNIRQFIKIGESGVAESGSLRNIRTVKDGIVLIGEIKSEKELTVEQERDLLFILKAVRNIGMMKNRGRGEVEFKIYNGSKNLAEVYGGIEYDKMV